MGLTRMAPLGQCAVSPGLWGTQKAQGPPLLLSYPPSPHYGVKFDVTRNLTSLPTDLNTLFFYELTFNCPKWHYEPRKEQEINRTI